MKKTWFITGASRGLGRIWAEAALSRGDQVAATARTLADVADLSKRFGDSVLPLALDVTNAEQVKQVVAGAHAHFGKLDVIINNAGYSLVGTIEEATEADVRALYDANFFGTLRVIQAALPLLRQQGSGHILGVSSSLAIAAMPLIGFYCSTKWAVEGLHESLAIEVKSFGIKVTMLEPGAYATEFGSPKSLKMAQGMDVYAELRQRVFGGLQTAERGDPHEPQRKRRVGALNQGDAVAHGPHDVLPVQRQVGDIVLHRRQRLAHVRTLRLADGPDEVHRETIAKIEIAKHA